MDMTELVHAGETARAHLVCDGPDTPQTLEATGLRRGFVIELVLKHLYLGDELGVARLSERIGLPVALLDAVLRTMRSSRLVEPAVGYPGGGTPGWRLSTTGRARAAEAMARCRYAGAAPVVLAQYRERVLQQAANDDAMSSESLASVLQGLVLDDDTCQRLGAALSSTRGLYVFGPPGSGKSALAGRLAMVSRGTVWIPHAVLAGDELIQVFDPSVHRPVDKLSSQSFSVPPAWSEAQPAVDARWIACERPVVLAGSSLSVDQFDLQSAGSAGAAIAPIQLKANNGVLLIDDLGRQREPVQQLLRRVVMPLEAGCDHLRMNRGECLEVPLALRLVLASTLAPTELRDDGLVRRLGYQIPLGALEDGAYSRLVRETSSALGVPFEDSAAAHLINGLHRKTGVPMLAAYPRELITRICERARWLRRAPALDNESLNWAWSAVFGAGLKGVAS